MFRISFYIKKKEDVSSEVFRDYWLGEHADLTMKFVKKLGVRRYIKGESLPDHPLTIASQEAYQTGPIQYDFIDHWFFNDIEHLKAGAADQAVISLMQAAFESETRYVDIAASNVLMTVDLAQFYPPDSEEVKAEPGGRYVKIYYPVRIQDHLTRGQAQLHWNACHGAESRQHIKYSMQKKYVQCHAIDSTFCFGSRHVRQERYIA